MHKTAQSILCKVSKSNTRSSKKSEFPEKNLNAEQHFSVASIKRRIKIRQLRKWLCWDNSCPVLSSTAQDSSSSKCLWQKTVTQCSAGESTVLININLHQVSGEKNTQLLQSQQIVWLFSQGRKTLEVLVY